MSKLEMAKLEHSPTLNTVIMVEQTLKNANESVLKIADLKKTGGHCVHLSGANLHAGRIAIAAGRGD